MIIQCVPLETAIAFLFIGMNLLVSIIVVGTNLISSYTILQYRAAACDVICPEAVVLLGGKTMERLYGNGRTFTLFLLTSPALVIEHLQY